MLNDYCQSLRCDNLLQTLQLLQEMLKYTSQRFRSVNVLHTSAATGDATVYLLVL